MNSSEPRVDLEVWFVSNFPPPVHGVAVFNTALVEQLRNREIPHRIFRVGTRGALAGVERLGPRKAIADAASVAQLSLAGLAHRLRSSKNRPVVYFTPSQGGNAVLRDWLVARYARAAGIPLVAHIHGCGWLNVWRSGGRYASMMRDVLAQCRAVICLGPTYAKAMREATGLPCVGINNGVRVRDDVTSKAAPSKTQRVELLYLSNLIKLKGLWEAAQSVAELRKRGVSARLTCAGAWLGESDRRQFETDFAPEIEAGDIYLAGFADERAKIRLLSQAHFFILPTAYPLEGQPLGLVEAMAQGVVPITTTQGAIVDLLGFDQWEVLARAEHRDPTEIASTVDQLTKDREAYEVLSRRCLEHTRKLLNDERCLGAVLETLHSACQTPLDT